MTIPMPPFEMRELVGPTDEGFFDNPTGAVPIPGITQDDCSSIFDFGCGCGRMARQLLQMARPPDRYLGIDLHRGMISWCRQHLEPLHAGFRFHHHDVYNRSFNPLAEAQTAPFPVGGERFRVVLAWSVFTHLLQDQVEFYLREAARSLEPNGTLVSTWFLFDRAGFPMLQASQAALYINPVDLSNAVIFDREWFQRVARDVGLTISDVKPPAIRGYAWEIQMRPSDSGIHVVDFPPDNAPIGSLPPPAPDHRLETIGT
jgi:SAM-dependent methyltransferase